MKHFWRLFNFVVLLGLLHVCVGDVRTLMRSLDTNGWIAGIFLAWVVPRVLGELAAGIRNGESIITIWMTR